ncbi:MAG: gamma-glutamyltranspeptidase, partial [Alphaproteobacteria bacterium]|nr:gamma-glutamyltranspeptidase [Alphaproteobacteria bacterium]
MKRRQSWGLHARALSVMLAATVLGACAGPDKAADLVASAGDGHFFGGVATDEPRATLIGRDVLMAGGTAADAAVAVYFTLAVTYPSNASLGAGGTCLVQDPDVDDLADTVRALEFLPGVAVGSATANPRRATAVPAAVRGMFALYSRYGRLDWARLVAPAENLARFGHPISRALARDLSLAESELFDDRDVRRIFGDAEGLPLVEGQRLTQLDLAAVLAQVRIKGPGDFYGGDLA